MVTGSASLDTPATLAACWCAGAVGACRPLAMRNLGIDCERRILLVTGPRAGDHEKPGRADARGGLARDGVLDEVHLTGPGYSDLDVVPRFPHDVEPRVKPAGVARSYLVQAGW